MTLATYTSTVYNKGAELIAKSLGIPTYTVDPYSKDYIQMMESLAEAIVK